VIPYLEEELCIVFLMLYGGRDDYVDAIVEDLIFKDLNPRLDIILE